MATRALNRASRDIQLNDAIPGARHTGWTLSHVPYLLNGTFCGDSTSSGKCMCVAGAFPALRYVRSIFPLWLALSVLCVAAIWIWKWGITLCWVVQNGMRYNQVSTLLCAVKAKVLSSSDNSP